MRHERVHAGLPFGHRHGEQEEVYVVLEGSARVKVEDDDLELMPGWWGDE